MIRYDVLKFTTVFIENINNKGVTSSGTGFFVGFEDKPTVLVTEKHVVEKADLTSYKGNCFLGIDAGSTTTKMALSMTRLNSVTVTAVIAQSTQKNNDLKGIF